MTQATETQSINTFQVNKEIVIKAPIGIVFESVLA